MRVSKKIIKLIRQKCLLFLFFSLLMNLYAFAQPSTSGCNYAGTKITVGSSCTPSTMDSNGSTDYWDSASGCNSDDRDDVWWWF